MTFWDRVDRSGGPDACWPWMGARTNKGYGVCSTYLSGVKSTCSAHRMAAFLAELTYDLRAGSYSKGLVLHSCDSPSCCNPKHLRIGTQQENVADATARGRRNYRNAPRGLRSYCAKLTAEQVRSIRAEYAAGGTSTPKLGKKYGISHETVRNIVNGVSYVDVV